MTTWGPPFEGTGEPPVGYRHSDRVQFQMHDGKWTMCYPSWFRDYKYRLPSDHPFYKTVLTPVEQAITTLTTEGGYTLDESTGVLTPRDSLQDDRDFVADMWSFAGATISADTARQGRQDKTVSLYMQFIRDNKHRIKD